MAKQRGMLLLICDQCVTRRRLATGESGDAKPMNLVDGVAVGCFPDLYEALGLILRTRWFPCE